MEYSVWVVDDELMSLRVVKRVFDKAGIAGEYFQAAADVLSRLKGTGSEKPDLVMLDIHMPDINGFELLKQLKADPVFRNVPVIFLTGDEDVKSETIGLNAGAADFIRKPFAAEVMLKRVRNTIELNRLHNDMAHEIKAQTEKLSRAYIQIVQALAASVDAKDRYTHGHSPRVAAYSREIAKRAGLSVAEQDSIYMMGLLHDVGKIGIQDAIINKTGRLTDEEYAEIKTHPVVGYEILRNIEDYPELMVGRGGTTSVTTGEGIPMGLQAKTSPR